MIEYLEKLVEEKEYEKALAYAEQLLLDPNISSWNLMVVYSMLCVARCETGEYYGGQVAGQLAVKMAQALEAWDYYGSSAVRLGVCYDRLRQPENAIAAWYDYLTHLRSYSKALVYHTTALYNIGLVLGSLGRYEESILTLQQAAEVAQATRDPRKAHGIRHALIDAHLRYGKLDQVPALLAKCAHYLRNNPSVAKHTLSGLWHIVLRVRYALATNRVSRAFRVAQRGLRLAEGWPHVIFALRMLMARGYEQMGDFRSAMEEALHARRVSMDARRFDLEYTAANYMYELLNSYPDLTDSLRDIVFENWDPTAVD